MIGKLISSLFFRRTHSHYRVEDFPAEPRILVIRFKWIGDVMLTSVLANSLKTTFPKAQVHYLMHQASADLFGDHDFVDQAIAISPKQRKNPFAYWRVLWRLRKTGYDLIIDAQSTNKSELVSLVCAKRQAICIGREKAGRGRFFTHTENATPALGHKITERLALLKPLREMGFPVTAQPNMSIVVPNSTRAAFKKELKDRGVSFDRPLFVFAVTAKLPYKKWRMQHIQEVAQHCLLRYDAQLVLYYGSEAELDDVYEFHAQMESNPDIITGIKTQNLMELAALISHCDLFIGNEGGPRHIAQALRVPSVAVFSPSAKKSEWLPSESRAHQGVEWDDLVDKPLEQKKQIHQTLEIGSKQYRQLYRMITAQPVIELVDDVADFVGIKARKP